MSRKWLVEIRQTDHSNRHPLQWPIRAHKFCWSRTGARLWASRFYSLRGLHVRVTNIKEIS